MALVVRGVPFQAKGVYGDFAWMIRQPEYAKSIFVFNDNVVDGDDMNPHDGAGSAAIRTQSWKYTFSTSSPRALGIPTGWSVATGGFKVEGDGLEPFAARAITLAFERLLIACMDHEVDEVIYSCDKTDPTNRRLGCGIFDLAPSLLLYIEDKLHGLLARVQESSKFTLSRIVELEAQVAHVGRLHQKLALALNRGVKREPPDDNKRRLVILPRMPPGDEVVNDVRYIAHWRHVRRQARFARTCQKSRACFTRARSTLNGSLYDPRLVFVRWAAIAMSYDDQVAGTTIVAKTAGRPDRARPQHWQSCLVMARWQSCPVMAGWQSCAVMAGWQHCRTHRCHSPWRRECRGGGCVPHSYPRRERGCHACS